MARRIFISYRRADEPSAAARIRDGLSVKFGPRHVFFDIDSLLPGGKFDEALANALDRSDILLVVIGRHWAELLAARGENADADYVRKEIAGALRRNLTIIPVRVGHQGRLPTLPRPDDLPADVRNVLSYQTQDITYENMARDIGALTTAIERLRVDAMLRRSGASRWLPTWMLVCVLAVVLVGLLALSAKTAGMDKAVKMLGDDTSGMGILGLFEAPDIANWRLYLEDVGRTLAVALWGVSLAALVSVPLAISASAVTSNSWVAWPIRRISGLVEATEIAILGVVLMILLGLGPLTAVVAIFAHSTAILTRTFSEAIETANRPIEGVRQSAASGGQVIYAVVPDVIPLCVAATAMRFSSAVRAAIVLEIVSAPGGGGIGQRLLALAMQLDFAKLPVALAVFLVTLILVDVMARAIGRRLGPS